MRFLVGWFKLRVEEKNKKLITVNSVDRNIILFWLLLCVISTEEVHERGMICE